MDLRGTGPGLISVIFTGLIMLAVLGWVTSTVLNSIDYGENDENDILGVKSGIETYGPTIISIMLIGFFVLGVAALLRYLGAV